MTQRCPHCNRPADADNRMHGDRVWCLCGKWYVVLYRFDRTVYLVKCDAPDGLPQMKRRPQR
jgi:hypothetical protein